MKPQPIIRSIGSTFFVYYSNLRDDLNSSKMTLAVYDINDLHKNKMNLTNDDNNIPYTIIKGGYYDWYWKPLNITKFVISHNTGYGETCIAIIEADDENSSKTRLLLLKYNPEMTITINVPKLSTKKHIPV